MGPELIASILVLIGAAFMIFSIKLGMSLQRVVPDKLKNRWKVLISLKLFFLAGYILFISILFSSYNFSARTCNGIYISGRCIFCVYCDQPFEGHDREH